MLYKRSGWLQEVERLENTEMRLIVAFQLVSLEAARPTYAPKWKTGMKEER